MVDIPSLGVTLRELRTLRELTQKQLAERLGVAQAQISQIEAGTYTPSLNVLEDYLHALDSHLCIELNEGGIHYGSTGLDATPPGETGSGEASDGWDASPIR